MMIIISSEASFILQKYYVILLHVCMMYDMEYGWRWHGITAYLLPIEPEGRKNRMIGDVNCIVK